MAKLLFTDKAIAALPAPVRGRARYWDMKCSGLCVAITIGNSRSYYVATRLHGKLTWRRIGLTTHYSVAQARAQATQMLASLARGVDPKPERPAPTAPRVPTFRSVAIAYREDKVAHLRTWAKYSRRLDLLIKAWGSRPITEISRRDVIDLLLATRKAHGDNPARHLIWGCAAPLFTWCEARDIVPVSPLHGMKPKDFLAPRPERDRVLDEEEMRAIWEACAEEDAPRPFGVIIRLLMLTGLRRQEIADLRWSEIRWGDKPTLVLPASRMKMQREHVVPLCPMAAALIHAVPRRLGEDRLFSRISFGQKQLWLDPACGVGGWVVHDLRRSARTYWAELGIQDHVAERLLAHSTQSGVAKVYNRHSYQEEMRRALLAWEAKLMEILAGNIVRLMK
jgi:integrase